MCCYKNKGMCDLCRDFQLSLFQSKILMKSSEDVIVSMTNMFLVYCYVCTTLGYLFADILKSFPGAATKIETASFQDDLTNTMYPPSPVDIKPSQAERAEDLLQQLESQCKQGNTHCRDYQYYLL